MKSAPVMNNKPDKAFGSAPEAILGSSTTLSPVKIPPP